MEKVGPRKKGCLPGLAPGVKDSDSWRGLRWGTGVFVIQRDCVSVDVPWCLCMTVVCVCVCVSAHTRL